MVDYLRYFPKPLLDDLANGRWLPVVGAGMSLNAVLPPGKKMPLWKELGEAFEDHLTDFSASGPVDAMSAYEHEHGRARLVERLSEVLHLRHARPGEAHRAFCSIRFDLVCTTNFDFLLEKQYDSTAAFVTPVVDEEQLSFDLARDGTLLLKLHGDLRHPSRLVVTEADYDAFLSTYPLVATYLANLLITRTAVLVGYSLDDPDFRQVWHVVTQRLGRTRRRAYALAVGAPATDQVRFARRGVTLINLPQGKREYGEVLADAFDQLAAYWRDRVLAVSTVTEEAPLRELKLPRDSNTRLVYFSVALERLPLYREIVFPEVEAAGLVPVSADDVVSPGDSVNAKIDALMDRASVVVVEVGSAWTWAELRLAAVRTKDAASGGRRSPHVIVVGDAAARVPAEDLDGARMTRLGAVLEGGANLDELIEVLRAAAPTEFELGQEPRRLLAKREYRAAVISALGFLETSLRSRLDKPEWTRVRRPMSIQQLLDTAMRQQLVTPADRERIEGWLKLRNAAVHSAAPVDRHAASALVDGVMRIVSGD